jgi:mercuric ion transport protein
MPKIEFIYEQSCPNVADARMQLRLALKQTGLPVRWQEWERNDPGSPAYARRYGSPSILVDGRDVAGEPAAEKLLLRFPHFRHPWRSSDAPSCRIYTNSPGRNRGVPDAALIRTALEHSMENLESPRCKC